MMVQGMRPPPRPLPPPPPLADFSRVDFFVQVAREDADTPIKGDDVMKMTQVT
jgi:hypothetical protein